MSGVRLTARLARPLPRLALHHRYLHQPAFYAGGLRPSQASHQLRHSRRKRWPYGANFLHNLPAVRSASGFARVLPSLAMKLVRIPAMMGAAAIGGMAYLQYQAQQAGTYTMDLLRQGRDVASGAAGSAFNGFSDIAAQMGKGWEKTKEEANGRFGHIFEGKGGDQHGGANGGGPGPEKPPSQSRGAGAVAGTGAAFGYTQSPEDDERSNEETARDDQMMVLTKKMIEIRSILQVVGQSNALVLPSIVVIGSQSSGKSSVLEAVVGHEFLPKGSNMITRRPIELTLVNTPDAQAEYGEFPALGLGKITDFAQIQKTLTDLNLAVPAEQCVSDDPIQLKISSPNVPDLSLIDLPGYIQVSGLDQPTELKQKIADLCDRYIQPPNVILAISAADVDLANSTALRASRRVDPRGERTIGVITKMDLVEPERGASMLGDRKYPLRLGYVGVVSRVPQQTGLFSRGSGNITNAITKNETSYFSSHPLEFGPESQLSLGTTTLRKKLMHVLEQTMAASLQSTSDAINQELEEATYEFKVQYNDRPLSADSYLAESLDAFKHSFKAFAESFGRSEVQSLLKEELDQRVLDLLAQRYWNKPITDLTPPLPDPDPLSALPKSASTSPLWARKLDTSTSSLTKSGIGRLSTTLLSSSLESSVATLVSSSTFNSHPLARDLILSAAQSILHDRFYSTSDQVENCIKPYKFEYDLTDTEWRTAQTNVSTLLRKELAACDTAIKALEHDVGGKKKLRDVTTFIDRVRRGDVVLETEAASSGGAGGFSSALLAKGRESLFLSHRSGILSLRLAALQQKPCTFPPSSLPPSSSNSTSGAAGGTPTKPTRPSQATSCPELVLDALAQKLVSTSVLFLNIELLSEFYYHFPRQLDLAFSELSDGEKETLVKQDQRVSRHIEAGRRKELLERVRGKIEGLRGLGVDGKIVGAGVERGRGLGKGEGREEGRKRRWFS